MGAATFISTGIGKNAREAFRAAQDTARAYNGHQEGYSGDIQGKSDFIVVTPSVVSLASARKLASKVLNQDTSPVCDKYGPAGAVRLCSTAVKSLARGNEAWLFFGWAPC